MGLLLSILLSYAGTLELIEIVKHIMYGILPENDPDFEDIVAYYTEVLQKSANPSSLIKDWINDGGQGYLCINEDKKGKLKSVDINYYSRGSDSTALLFSTKISSFGQESLESDTNENDPRKSSSRTPERYIKSSVTTQLSQTDPSLSIGGRQNKSRSPTPYVDNLSDSTWQTRSSEAFFGGRDNDSLADSEPKEKLKWHYRPLSPSNVSLPEIHFQSYERDPPGFERDSNSPYPEELLRSLDGVKLRPLRRTDPSGRRRSFKKRSSSSSSSRDSRTSREEELRDFTSLEEAEFESFNKNAPDYSSTPNLAARSHSRSQSKEKGNVPLVDASWPSEVANEKPHIKDIPKLDSFEEETNAEANDDTNQTEESEVTDEQEITDDFWGNSSD